MKHSGITRIRLSPAVAIALALQIGTVFAADFDIRDYGANGDGKTVNTTAIQKAIDACSASGGGRVVVDGGTYSTGTVILKSGVELHIEANAVLLGSPDWRDWKDQPEARHIDQYNCPRHRSAALVFAEPDLGTTLVIVPTT